MTGDPGGAAPSPPLLRLTLEEDDAAATWLSSADRVRAWFWSYVPMLAVWVVLTGLPLAWVVARSGTHARFPGKLYVLLCAAQFASAGLYTTLRWAGLQLQDRAVRRLARRRAGILGRQLDDWDALERAPEGEIVSAVGWIRARQTLGNLVDGRPCVGLVLDCQTARTELVATGRYSNRRRPIRQAHNAIVEASHDFELIDEAGRTLPVRVADARLLGWRNVHWLGDDLEEQRLLASLPLPLAVTPVGANVYALRDGDPVLVIGFKATVADPTIGAQRGPAERAGLASRSPRPLLICALRAERRPKAAA